MKKLTVSALLVMLVLCASGAIAADSVDVVFTYKSTGTPVNVYLPGEFNGWANNNGGVISPGPAWNMTKDPLTSVWSKTVRLQVGGGAQSRVPGAYQYKFNENGTSNGWRNDPLNQHINLADNSNSLVYVKDPTIFHFLPNQRNPVVNTSFPVITASIFPKVGSTLDTSTLAISIDGTVYTGIGSAYNFLTKQMTFTPASPLPNGNHVVILTAGTSMDTVNFTTHGGFVQIVNEFPFTTVKTAWILNGTVGDTSITSLRIVRNGIDTFNISANHGTFSQSVPLTDGTNQLVAIADSAGHTVASSPVTYVRFVSHAPLTSVIVFHDSVNVTLIASGTDPDSNQTSQLTYLWSADSTNPAVLPGVAGATSAMLQFPVPASAGEYYVGVITTDPDGHKDTTRSYFTVNPDHSVSEPLWVANPEWARKARIYFIFPKAFTSQGTINAAAQKLQYIKDMGFNCIWLTPVMKNAYPIDNNYGIGYNITDFYTVAPEYGTNQDIASFVTQAHALGIRVILDITPNHMSRFHTISADAHTFKANSPYWSWFQHAFISHNDNGLGQSADADNFWYYSGFSDQLLNLDWTDADLRAEMINVFKHWITMAGVDGFRFDVYWGPHRRYGEQFMGMPVRNALKHIKPDILLLGEDEGTGSGTQTIYADYSNAGIHGGLDMAYDFKLYFNQIRSFGFNSTAVTNLHSEIDNGGYYPGVDALYMRFMESQDEDRIAYFYSGNGTLDMFTSLDRTMPMASVIFTCPGVPMLYNGQEIGWGYGISGAKEARNRSVINWTFFGKNILLPHYQILANIRDQFRAFTQHKQDTNNDNAVNGLDAPDFVRVTSSNAMIYAFGRPYTDQNGLTVVNFSDVDGSTTLNLLSGGALRFSTPVQPSTMYYLNNLYDNTRTLVSGSQLASLTLPIPGYGTAVYTVSTTPDSVIIEHPILGGVATGPELPRKFELRQNYPNPFNPATTIAYTLPSAQHVMLKVYNVLGAEIATLVDAFQQPGGHSVTWNAGAVASGVYYYRLTGPSNSAVKPMILLR